jgi:hypothetical protein
VTREKIEELWENGFVEPGDPTAPYAANPVTAAAKKDSQGEWTEKRFCINYKKVNRAQPPNKYRTQTPEEIFDRMAADGATVFSHLDMRAGFHQLPLAQSSRKYEGGQRDALLRRHRAEVCAHRAVHPVDHGLAADRVDEVRFGCRFTLNRGEGGRGGEVVEGRSQLQGHRCRPPTKRVGGAVLLPFPLPGWRRTRGRMGHGRALADPTHRVTHAQLLEGFGPAIRHSSGGVPP